MISEPSNSAAANTNKKHLQQPQQNLEAEALRRDILIGRKFTLADVLSREAGSFLKGESPIPKFVQATTEINTFIDRNLPDVSGALQAVLHRWVNEDMARVCQHPDAPLQALLGLLESIIENSSLLHELVRQVDVKWGEMNDERPHFQRPAQAPHPDDEYTHESVHQQLVELIHYLKSFLTPA